MFEAHPPQQVDGVLVSNSVWAILARDDTTQQSNYSHGAAQPLIARNSGFVRQYGRIRSHINDRRALRIVHRL